MLIRYPAMLTPAEVRVRAQAHLDAHPLWHPEYRYVLREGHELPHGWYFPYAYEHVGGLPPDQWEQFLGAAGFVVCRETGAVEVTALVPAGVYPPRRRRWRFWAAG